MKGLLQEYSGKKKEIRERLGHFRSVWKRPEKKVFEELAFCLFTPQTSATDRKSTRLNSSHSQISYSLFFFNDTATTEIYTLSLHDALPIFSGQCGKGLKRKFSRNLRSACLPRRQAQ